MIPLKKPVTALVFLHPLYQRRSHEVVQADLELVTLLPQPSENQGCSFLTVQTDAESAA